MHNQEVGVVDVELYTLKQVLHRLLLRAVAIDQVFRRAPQHDLSRYRDGGVFLEADGRSLLVFVVEHNGDAGLCHAGLAALVDEILEVLRADGGEVGDAEDEADGVEDVGFSGAVEAGDGVEGFVPARDYGADGIGLEALLFW